MSEAVSENGRRVLFLVPRNYLSAVTRRIIACTTHSSQALVRPNGVTPPCRHRGTLFPRRRPGGDTRGARTPGRGGATSPNIDPPHMAREASSLAGDPLQHDVARAVGALPAQSHPASAGKGKASAHIYVISMAAAACSPGSTA